jgi:hypothetical protein
VYPSVLSRRGKRTVAFVFALVFSALVAGCHGNNLDSGFGIGWVTITDEPGDFAAYIVQVDSVIMTGVNNGEVTVLDIPETVDFTKLKNVAELWGSASIPSDTYTSAIITIDYTSADIEVVVNGAPQQATVVDPTGAAVTTISVTVNLDPVNLAYSIPTYATTAGIRLAIDFDLAASNTVNLASTPNPTVYVSPYFTVATSASDQKPILVRGPLVNTSLDEQSYSVYVRPFFDEVNTAGTLTLFNANSPLTGGSATTTPTPSCPQNNPVYTINGTAYTGGPGVSVLSGTSAGSTMTEALTTYVPTVTPSATAAVFCVNYMVGGSTLEDFYTFGLEGDVIARTGNTLTLRGPTLFLTSDEYVTGLTSDYQVLLGSGTLVTQDGAPSDAALNSNSISVGQHIIVRGVCNVTTTTNSIGIVVNTCVSQNGFPTLDATGTSSTNTGSVRIQSTQIFGSLVANAAGSLTMNMTGFNQYPASSYNFAGTGTSAATNAVAANYVVNTDAVTVPSDLTVGGPVWVDGVVTPFGSAPPDFSALDVEDEVSEPATLLFTYLVPGTASAFLTLTDGAFQLDLSNNQLIGAHIRIGQEDIDLTAQPGGTPLIEPQIVPPAPPPITVPTSGITTAQLPPTFLPLFCVGSTALNISCFNSFTTFTTTLQKDFTGATPSAMFAIDARGSYNRATNIFTAASINVVL